MSLTPNYELFLTDDDAMLFKDWREKINGKNNSNMTIIDTVLAGKQDKISGQSGQMVGFGADGSLVAQPIPDTGVVSFNGRKDAVTPQAGDYTAEMVGARPDNWMPEAEDVGAVPISGGTMTGRLTLSSDPTSNLHAATKAYVDESIQAAILDSWGASY